MFEITPREIAQLSAQDQRNMQRWIGEHSALAELSAQHRTNRAIRQAIDEAEKESPDAQPFEEPEQFPWDDEQTAAEAA